MNSVLHTDNATMLNMDTDVYRAIADSYSEYFGSKPSHCYSDLSTAAHAAFSAVSDDSSTVTATLATIVTLIVPVWWH